MKIVSLNTWAGRIHEPILKFFKENQDLDIFCLQEVYYKAADFIVENKGDRLDLLSEIKEVLPDHEAHFHPHVGNYFGLATFVKKSISIAKEGDTSIYESVSTESANHSRNLQFLEIELAANHMTVANVHGLWNGKGKTDSEDRLEQSRRIKDFMNASQKPRVLCGDFNLLPETESIKILESTGMRNLIKEYGITSTRTSLYNKHEKPVLYADYMFVDPEVRVTRMKSPKAI